MPTPHPQASVRPPVLRLAGRIRAQLLAGRGDPPSGFVYALDNLTSRTTQLSTIRRRWELCQEHQLQLAAAKVQEELSDLLRCLPEEADQVTRQIPNLQSHALLPLTELVQEFATMEEEFGSWSYDKEEHTLSVTTEPIVLEERHLGPFEIRLAINRLGQNNRQGGYKVVALKPHPAASNDAVTHPHVSEEHLCEGEAAAPIHAALTEGRIGDFFVLVRCVLTTYNPASPYVALDAWEGTSCHDCGYITDDDHRSYCEACGNDYCEDCMSYCRSCDESQCRSCLEECPCCEENTCSSCLKRCTACGEKCCTSCLAEGACPACRKEPEETSPSDQGDIHETQSRSPTPGESPIVITACESRDSSVPVDQSVVAVTSEPTLTPPSPRRRRTRRSPRRTAASAA